MTKRVTIKITRDAKTGQELCVFDTREMRTAIIAERFVVDDQRKPARASRPRRAERQRPPILVGGHE